MLKSLELFGFKSFADRTRFDFAPGITGVVGPNGSGKSNVVDAIKWILGDQSAKSLRGKEMVDVIFNGAAGRKPAGLAEATLTFDNTSGFLPVESPEVQIGRRIWRSGESEYLINKASSRLKDVRDLFLGTGAGSAAYCIIEQGRVDQILQANATNRRMVFEEAAGVSRFKLRRANALRNLERVDQNLLRLTDIVDEVEAQLNSLRSQAVKAARYREISARLKEWWLGLAADQCRTDRERLALAEQAVREHQEQVEQLNGRLQALEADLGTLDAEINSVEDRLREAERRSAANREQVAGHESSLRHQTARKDELEAELVRLRKQRTTMAAREQEALAELERAGEQLRQLEQEHVAREEDLARKEKAIGDLQAELAERRGRMEQARQELIESVRGVSEASQQLAQLEVALDAAKVDAAQNEDQLIQLEEHAARCRGECAARREVLSEAEGQLAAVGDRLRALQGERRSMMGEQHEFQRNISQLRETRSAWQARKSLLEDLEERQEGLGIGVKEILSRAQTMDSPPWNQILGTVADLLDVDLEQAALLEVALGSRAQLIVLEEFDPLLDYLHQATVPIQGRVGFVALLEESTPGPEEEPGMRRAETGRFEHFRIKPELLPDLHGKPGVQYRADQLVKHDGTGRNLARQLLADTWVVDSLEDALKLSAEAGKGCRFVTLQGELLEGDGTLTVGTVRSETAVVSRKSELRRLRHDLVGLERQIADEEARLDELVSSLKQADKELAAAEADVKEAVDRHAELKSDLTDKERELARLASERESIEKEIAEIVAQAGRIEEDLSDARGRLAAREARVQSLQQEVDRSERELADGEQRLQGLRETLNTEKVGLAKHEERVQALRTACERLQNDLRQRSQQSEEAERRFEAATTHRRQVALNILNANAALAELMLTQEGCTRDAAVHLAERDQLRRRRSTLLKEEAALREERRNYSDRQHKAEIQAHDVQHQIQALEQRIEEEYQMPLAEVIASGASAVELYRAEKTSGGKETSQDEPAEDEDAAPRRVDEQAGGEAQADDAAEPRDEIRFEDVRPELEARVNRLRRQLKLMGSVNTDSLHDLDELERRFGYLSEQLEDLVQAKQALEDIVRRINNESERLFAEAFESIRGHFRELFRKLFGGGEGDVILEDPNDILECGIDIVARPPGKELRSISLLSGGEKTLTAVALLLSIFKSRPSPFCILDEVDAALDEANVDRFVSLLREFRETTQFIMITHSKRSMTVADVLYGVTMEQSGVSKRMSVRFEDVGENGEFKTPGAPAPGSGSGARKSDLDAA